MFRVVLGRRPWSPACPSVACMASGMSRALAHVNHTQHDCSAIPETKGGRVSHTYVCGIYPHMACFRWPAYHSRGWRRWGCMLVLGMVGSARLPRQHCFLRLPSSSLRCQSLAMPLASVSFGTMGAFVVYLLATVSPLCTLEGVGEASRRPKCYQLSRDMLASGGSRVLVCMFAALLRYST